MSEINYCVVCRLHGPFPSCPTNLCKIIDLPPSPMNQSRNPTGYPHHHKDCRVLHSVRTHPCFPQSNDAHTKLQKKWIEENKENIPPPNLQRQEAFSHPKKKLWTKEDEPEAIEEDDSESDSEEEEGHNGTQHRLPSRSVNSSSHRTGNTSKQ